MIVIGYHAVEALIKAGHKIRSIHIFQRERTDRSERVLQLSASAKISVKEYAPKEAARYEAEFKKAGGTGAEFESAQGIFAQIDDIQYVDHLELLRTAREQAPNPLVLYLDSITDPQNLGSILRSAAFFGVHGVVIPEARSAPVTATVLKVSSGGFAHLQISRVSNLVNALKEAKEEGFWIVGLSEHATQDLAAAHFDVPLGLVVGNEEKGIRNLTEKNCDYTIALPGNSEFICLNASVATAVALSLIRNQQKAGNS